MKFAALHAVMAAALLAGCATTVAPASRTSLTTEEIATLKPELTIHSTCIVGKFRDYVAGTTDVQLIVESVIQNCRGALVPLSERLDSMNLKPASREAYLRAVEQSSANVITDVLLKARSRAAQPGAKGSAKDI